MPATTKKSVIPKVPVPSRQSIAAGLRTAEAGLAAARRQSEWLLGRAELYLRAWREALDPSTAGWVERARSSPADKTVGEARADLQERIVEARRRA